MEQLDGSKQLSALESGLIAAITTPFRTTHTYSVKFSPSPTTLLVNPQRLFVYCRLILNSHLVDVIVWLTLEKTPHSFIIVSFRNPLLFL